MAWSLPPALNPRRSLRARFALVLGGSGLAFALLSALAVDAYQRAQLVDSVGHALRREATLLKRSLDVALQERLQVLRQTASQQVLATGLMEAGDVRLLLEDVRAQQPSLAWLAVTDTSGVVQVATGSLFEGQPLDDPRWFSEAAQGPWVGPRRAAGRLAPHLGLQGHGEPPALIDLGTPVIDYQGRTIGALVARLRWDWLAELHRSMDSPERGLPGSQSLVIDRSGQLLLGPEDRLGRPLQLPGFDELQRDGLARVLDWPQEGRHLTATGHDEPGTAGAGLTVLVRQPVAQAFQAADQMRSRLLAQGLAATALFMLLSLWLSGRVARPVQALSAAAEAVGRGRAPDFSAVPAGRQDEVAQLARTLQSLHDELARRLDEQQRATERFESLLHSAPVAIYIGQGGRVVIANQACLKLFGATSLAQLQQRSTSELFHADDQALVAEQRAKLALTRPGDGPLPTVEHRMVRMDGSVAITEVIVQRVHMGDGTAAQVVLVDVTEQRRAQALLRQREAQLAQTSAMAHVGGWSIDLLTGHTSWTDEMARIYELPPETRPTRELALSYLRGEHLAQLEAAVRRALRDGEPYDLQLQLTMPDGRHKWVRAQGRATRAGGRTVQIDGYTQDITERRAAEEAVRELNAQLEQRVADRTAQLQAANAELDSFAYAVSHDLRAPLRAMSGFSQALIEDHGARLDDEARLYLDQITLASRQMGELIEGLLVLSRSTRGLLQHDDVDISALAERALQQLRRQDPQRPVDTVVQPGLHARADRRMIDAVLQNLIGNAWKYTGRCAAPRIEVGLREIEGERWFSVTDNGAGFDMAHAGRLFKAFARLHRQDEFPGIGIGLATVQRIIHRHGGRITAEGAPGQGACFRFTLPERPEQPDDMETPAT